MMGSGSGQGNANANAEAVMRGCNCTMERAVQLLQENDNDVRKAVLNQQLLSSPVSQSMAPSEGNARGVFTFQSGSQSFPSTPPSNTNAPLFAPRITTAAPGGSATPAGPQIGGAPNTPTQGQEWNFVLPWTFEPNPLEPGSIFDIHHLAKAVAHGSSLDAVQAYLEYYDSDIVKTYINNDVYGFPPIFWAVASNNDMIVRAFVDHGANVLACHEESGIPLLAFAIVHSDNIKEDTTTLVATLLSLGTPPKILPSYLYEAYDQDIQGGKQKSKAQQGPSFAWFTDDVKKRLEGTLNLTQRYHLYRATKVKKASIPALQVAKLKHAEPILGLPYFLIGQSIASGRLLQRLLGHLIIPSKRPLVLTFAGPSGHGKTELARSIGYLLSLDLEVVDCTTMENESDLFGPRKPYEGAEEGSAVNNFLAKHDGKRSIIFLDEFEKTSEDVHQSLLLPFDNGEYQDRRNGTKIDCTQTIWILATNALDKCIQDFCGQNPGILGDDEAKKQSSAKKLSGELKQGFLEKFGAPLTGRISEFIPFVPFNAGEQAVVAHKFLLDLIRTVKKPIVLSEPHQQLMGDIYLRVRKDASVCRILAESNYSPDLGARSLATGLKHVEDLLVELYLNEDTEISEGKGLREFYVDCRGGEVVVRKG